MSLLSHLDSVLFAVTLVSFLPYLLQFLQFLNSVCFPGLTDPWARHLCLYQVYTAVKRQMNVTGHGGEKSPDQNLDNRRYFQWFSTAGSQPGRVTYQTSGISDVYITIHNGGKSIVMK